ncbi:uncharacterized protein METZ01_LOCUS510355 [marine metagenome]|uniref:Lipoprotein n=1 Tax=marine metagenome TaxID=408172 RepID=A0A383EL80_9ZZZZ
MKIRLICSVMALGLGCEHSGGIKEHGNIQGSFKAEADKVEFLIAIDKNGTKILFEQIPNTPIESSDKNGNPIGSNNEDQ